MSDAKAKALARQARIVAKGEARMAMAKGEVAPESPGIGIEDSTPVPCPSVPATGTGAEEAETPPGDGSAPSPASPSPATKNDTPREPSPEKQEASVPPPETPVEETEAVQVTPPPANKDMGVLARRREKIAAAAAAAAAAAEKQPSPPVAVPVTSIDPQDDILEGSWEDSSKSADERGDVTPPASPAVNSNTSSSSSSAISAAAASKSSTAQTKTNNSTVISASAADEDDAAVPSIADHASAVGLRSSSDKKAAAKYISVSKNSLTRFLNLGVILWIACMNGYHADVRSLSSQQGQGGAEAVIDSREDLIAFLGDSRRKAASSDEEFMPSTDPDEFDSRSIGDDAGGAKGWGYWVYSLIRRMITGVLENSFACVIVVYWFIVPKLMPYVEQILLLCSVIDSSFIDSASGGGGFSIISTVLSIVTGGFGGIIDLVLDVFSYIALHFLASIMSCAVFSVMFNSSVQHVEL
jgi:hypothetical protein